MQRSTIHDRYATAKFTGATVVRYGKRDEIYLDLAAGRIDATLVDAVAGNEGFLEDPAGKGYAFVGPEYNDPEFFGKGAGVAVRKGDARCATSSTRRSRRSAPTAATRRSRRSTSTSTSTASRSLGFAAAARMLHGYGPSLLAGAALTLAVALCALALAIVLGLAGALAKLSRSAFWRGAATAYTTLIRGVPDLVLMLLVFYGGQVAVNRIAAALGVEDYIDVDPFAAGVLTIGFIFGAYLTETFRGAIIAVPGARPRPVAFGCRRRRCSGASCCRRWSGSPSRLRNNWLVLVKSTALVSGSAWRT